MTPKARTIRLHSERLIAEVVADEPVAAVVNDIFVDLLTHSGDGEPDVSIRLEAKSDGFAISGSGRAHQGLSQQRLIDLLVSKLNLAAVAHGGDHLSLHAAGLARDGDAALIAGDTGAGKSSAALTLIRAGWGYMTDEVIWVDARARHVAGLPKPLTLKPGTRALFGELPHWPRADGTPELGVEPPRAYLPASRVGATIRGCCAPRLVVIIDPAVSAPVRLDPCQAVVAVTNNAFDVDRVGGAAGLTTVALLVARCPVVAVPRPAVAQLTELIDQLWDLSPGSDAVGVLPPRDATAASADGLARRPGVHGVTIGSGAVLRNDETSRLVTVDPMPVGLWDFLDGSHDHHSLCASIARTYGVGANDISEDVAEVVNRLRHEGIVA